MTAAPDFLLLDAPAAEWLLVLAHGAGAGMRHPFLEDLAEALAARSISSFRYQFPYMTSGRRRPDSKPVLLQTAMEAVAAAHRLRPNLRLLAGGKSMGGRMTSLAASQGLLPSGVCGLVFFGFPLHPAGKPSIDRARHLRQVSLPMLFLQGSRDRLAEFDLLKPVVESLGAQARLQVMDAADHSFELPIRMRRSRPETVGLLADWTRDWCQSLGDGPG